MFEDHASGARIDRAGLGAALDYVRDGEVLVVWKLDRLGRSLPYLIETVAALERRGVGFHSLTEAIDTTTPGGRLVFPPAWVLELVPPRHCRLRRSAALDDTTERSKTWSWEGEADGRAV